MGYSLVGYSTVGYTSSQDSKLLPVTSVLADVLGQDLAPYAKGGHLLVVTQTKLLEETLQMFRLHFPDVKVSLDGK